MVLKTDLMELRKQLKKETCHIQRMAGVYVAYDEGQKVIKCKFNRTFLNLEDDEFYKYLELAKKSITGNLGESILELPFRDTETQKVLSGIIASELKDENLIEAMAQKIIDEYDYLGNYLIIFYYDVYDVPVKTSDKMKLDNIYQVLIHFDDLYQLMNEDERRDLLAILISEIHIYDERQPNGQWLNEIVFNLPIIDKDRVTISCDNGNHVETVCLLVNQNAKQNSM